MYARSHSYVLIALTVYFCYFPHEEAATYAPGWILKVIFRDLVGMVIIFGGWDWVLCGHTSPWR